jgi:hypothetical protein
MRKIGRLSVGISVSFIDFCDWDSRGEGNGDRETGEQFAGMHLGRYELRVLMMMLLPLGRR